MLTRKDVQRARVRHLSIYGEAPAFLFLSLDAHTALLEDVRRSPFTDSATSLQGYQMYGMAIHVVTTLQGFHFKVA
jgi:hypothetical protein